VSSGNKRKTEKNKLQTNNKQKHGLKEVKKSKEGKFRQTKKYIMVCKQHLLGAIRVNKSQIQLKFRIRTIFNQQFNVWEKIRPACLND
jgi:hypothetical protein